MFSFFNRKKNRKRLKNWLDTLNSDSLKPMQTILEQGGNVNLTDSYHRTILHYAALHNRINHARFLISQNMNINHKDINYMTPLHFATQENHLSLITLLIENKVNINVQDKNGNTPLSNAVYYSDKYNDIIDLLLNKGANPDLMNYYGDSPRTIAKSTKGYELTVPS